MSESENGAAPAAVENPKAEQLMVPMPRYRSHKVVEAAKIVHVDTPPAGDTSLILDPLNGRDQFTWPVKQDWVERHKPEAGGYLVRYEDGYVSFSPAAAFEKGYRPEGAESEIAGPALREIRSHVVNEANDRLKIHVMDQPGAGGAPHNYLITGFNSDTNVSCPFKARHGKPAQHSTLLFQNGPINEVGVNGVTHEALLAILIDRLECFQNGPYQNQENAAALADLKFAQEALHRRTRARMQRGVEGTHAV